MTKMVINFMVFEDLINVITENYVIVYVAMHMYRQRVAYLQNCYPENCGS